MESAVAEAEKDADDLVAVHKLAMDRADEAWSFERDNIEAGREDQLFYAGDQWDDAAKAARKKRPMLTINRLPTTVRQLTGDVRQNTPSIKVLPARDATKEGADIRNGLIRNIEVNSDADACYAIAVENAAIAGQGLFRVVTEYSSNDGFDQDIRIRPIRDPFGGLVDPLAQLPDRSDMEYAFVFERMSKRAFEKAYPGKSIGDMPTASIGTFNWMPNAGTGESIRIAEYWCKKPVKKTLYLLNDGTVLDDPEIVQIGVSKGLKVEREREVEDHEVVSYIMNGKEILSGPHPWPGRHIPICFVPGEEITIDGATRRKGMVRDAKDPQRLYNYARTAAAESIALQPKAPFVLTKDQIKGYEKMWARAGTDNLPYLLVNGGGAQLPQRSQPALGQQGLDSQALISASDMEAVTGIFKANLGAPSNETSGKAILARQREGDTGTFLYPDNLSRAVRYCGTVINDLLGRVYDTERIVRILKEDGSHDMAEINKRVPNPKSPGEFLTLNDLSAGEYDVVVSTGPSYATKRAEAADAMMSLGRDVPAVGAVAPDLLVKALDIPYADEISERLKKTLPPHITGEGPPPGAEPPQPNPKDAATALKDAATADKLKAETEGIEIENRAKLLNLESMMAGLGQTLASLEPLLQQIAQQQPVQPPPGAPEGMAAPPAPPPPPMAAGMPDDMPPMAELDQPGATT